MAQKVAIEDTLEAPIEERRRDYEMTLVLSGKAGDEAREAVMGKIRRLISDSSGEMIEVSPQREYLLAYPILKEQQGVLRTLTFRSLSSLPNQLTTELKHEPALLRHLTIERPKHPAVPQRTFTPSSEAGTEGATSPAAGETPAVDTEKQDEQIEEAVSGL